MNISAPGLGHVGFVSAACLTADIHGVIGAEINKFEVDEIGAGRSPTDLVRVYGEGPAACDECHALVG